MSSDTNSHASLPDLSAAAAEVTRLLEGVRDDQLDASTPCPKYPVRDLISHVWGLSGAFQDAARKDVGPSTSTPPGSVPPPELPADWRDSLPARLAAMAEAWRDPAAWEGDTQAGGVTLPAAVMGRVGLDELVVHGWDLAKSTGQAYRPAQRDLEESYALLAPSKDDPSARSEAFGPAVAVPEGAPLLDRVIGLSGRDPAWTP
ncbi:TIGR03086 family metal-binding protein [Streptomyces sp. NPDC051994]|uniref:TIGR03086 family metal-binding protein n=1 Tax=unclassified Streptomyces TaxID=2593676 RepID=UPI003425BC3B